MLVQLDPFHMTDSPCATPPLHISGRAALSAGFALLHASSFLTVFS